MTRDSDMAFEWQGAEEDGYISKHGDLVLYVSPLPDGFWSWSVTSTRPLASVANHVQQGDRVRQSSEARVAAETAAARFLLSDANES